MAFDIGSKKTGVAQGDLDIGIGLPATIIRHDKNGGSLNSVHVSTLKTLLTSPKTIGILVGSPLLLSGNPSSRSVSNLSILHRWFEFADRPIPVLFWDERFSSAYFRAQKSAFKLSSFDDHVAAHLLQEFLDWRSRHLGPYPGS